MKNIIMQKIQLTGATPEAGVNYTEEVIRVGGEDHYPKFEVTVGYQGKTITVSGYNSKKALLKQAWREFVQECM